MSGASPCPTCGVSRGRRTGAHIKRCAQATEEERAHYREFFRWPRYPEVHALPDWESEPLTLLQREGLESVVWAGDRGVRASAFNRNVESGLLRRGLIEARDVGQERRLFPTRAGQARLNQKEKAR